MGWEYHRDSWLLSFVRDFHGPSPQIRRTVRKSGEHHHSIRKKHRSGMCSGKIADITAGHRWKEANLPTA
jgi:hypothetical protein